jgi:hypothetical protein
MPISIAGSGTITGISAGGLPDDCITTAEIAANAVTYAKIGTTEQGQLCKAWVNFNGTGTVAIRASYNVSSITDNGVGNYTVNFTTAMADTNYAVVSTAGRTYTSSDAGRACDINRINTNNFSITVFEAATYTLSDVVGVLASVFR